MHFFAADMGKLTAVAFDKPSMSKKHAREEKKSTKEKKTSPELEVATGDPAAPKVPKVKRKQKGPHKEKGIVIYEGVPEAKKSPLIPAGDKGKGVLHEPSPPPKKQKLNPPAEPAQAASTEEPATPSLRVHHDLFLKGAAGPVEVATASAAISRVFNSLSIMESDLWSKLIVDNP